MQWRSNGGLACDSGDSLARLTKRTKSHRCLPAVDTIVSEPFNAEALEVLTPEVQVAEDKDLTETSVFAR